MPAFTRDDAAAMAPPPGWRWYRRPTFEEYYNDPVPGVLTMEAPASASEARARNRAVYEWAMAFQAPDPDKMVMLEWAQFIQANAGFRYCSQVHVYLNYQMHPDYYQCSVECADGEHTATVWDETCPGGCGNELTCGQCQSVGRRHLFWDTSTSRFYCNGCARQCVYRLDATPGQVVPYGRRCGRRFFGGDFQYCEEHGDRTQCAGCERISERPIMFDAGEGRIYCPRCSELVCRHCGVLSPTGTNMQYHNMLDIMLCPGCWAEFEAAGTDEEFDDTDPGASALLLTKNTHRPVRVCSIELECAEPGGNALAKRLYEAGLGQWERVASYHSSQKSLAFCHVEYDRSLGEDGGELIFNKIDLSNAEDVHNMHRAISIVREQIKAKKLNMNMRCGLHVHVDAHGFGLGHVRNLVLLFNYLEDPLYQMASAKYVRHRGVRYSNKIDKGPYPDKQEFGKSFLLRNNHNHALNVSHYWQAMQQCGCGASMIGEHEKCVCTLGKCTFEFRIWNGTANIQKIAAYTAISQSLVAYARMTNDLNIEDFPVCEHFPARILGEETYEQWHERLEWMFRNLYFSPTERTNVMYLLRNSPLSRLGADRLNALEAITYQPPTGIPAQVYEARVSRTKKPTSVDQVLTFTHSINIPEPMFDDYDEPQQFYAEDEEF